MKSRRYYQYIEKDEHILSKKWRVLHIIFFIAILASSIIAADSFCDIFDIFNYRCVLFAQVSTNFMNIVYKNQSTDVNSGGNENHTEPELNVLRSVLNVDEKQNGFEMYSKNVFYINKAVKVPGAKDMYVMNEELWIDNENMTGRAHVDMTSTIFESVLLCDFIAFVPFFSIIISVFFIMVVVMFSRTGRRSLESVPPAHLYVLPLIVVAGIMTVLSVISTNLLFNGLEVFCRFFEHLTGKTECSPYMDYFTKEQRRGYRHLYFHILACKKSFLAAAIFWICQLIVGLLRVLTADDYTFTTVLIESKSKLHEEDAEEIFLMHWDSVAAPQLAAVVEKLKKEYVENQ